MTFQLQEFLACRHEHVQSERFSQAVTLGRECHLCILL